MSSKAALTSSMPICARAASAIAIASPASRLWPPGSHPLLRRPADDQTSIVARARLGDYMKVDVVDDLVRDAAVVLPGRAVRIRGFSSTRRAAHLEDIKVLDALRESASAPLWIVRT